MTEQTETSSDDGDGGCITVSGLVPVNGVTSHQIIEAVRATLHGREVRALNIAFVDDETIKSINERYLNKADVTDVISFDLRDDEDDGVIEGEIVVSGQVACVQAGIGVSVQEEVLRYVIHGVLHLMGYDDRTQGDRQRMSIAEDQVLSNLDIGHGTRVKDSGTREDI